jgi:hypothetical protein
MAKAVIPTTIAVARLTPAETMSCGESICGTATRGNRITGEDRTVGSVAVQKSADIDAEPEPARETDHEQVACLWE